MNLATVDASHVNEASKRVGGPARGSALATAANTIGGVVAGSGMASTYAVVFTAGPHETPEILTAIMLSVVGFVLLTLGLALSARRHD